MKENQRTKKMKSEILNIKQLEEKLNPLHLDDLNNEKHSSYFFKTPEYTLLIIRFFRLEDEGLEGVSIPYIATKEHTFTYERDSKEFFLMEEGFQSVCDSIEEQLFESEELILKYIEEIDVLEDALYTRKLSPIFLDLWFDLKKDITRIERILERAYATLTIYIKYHSSSSSFPENGFSNLLEHIERYQRLSLLNSSKLDTLYNYYNSLKSDKMNKNIYALTIVSGIFLPLNLVVGFFGMNTEGLFFHSNPSGTTYVVILLIVLFILFLAIIPMIAIIERLILQRLLGRFNLYNKLISKIKNITIFNSK